MKSTWTPITQRWNSFESHLWTWSWGTCTTGASYQPAHLRPYLKIRKLTQRLPHYTSVPGGALSFSSMGLEALEGLNKSLLGEWGKSPWLLTGLFRFTKSPKAASSLYFQKTPSHLHWLLGDCDFLAVTSTHGLCEGAGEWGVIVSLLCRNKELQKRVTGDLGGFRNLRLLEVKCRTFHGKECGGIWLKCPSKVPAYRVVSYS